VFSPEILRSYLAYRVNHEQADGNPLLRCIRQTACEIHRNRDISDNELATVEKCVEKICWPLGTSMGKSSSKRFADIFKWETEVSEEEYEKHLFAAAIRTNSLLVVRQCIAKNDRLVSLLQHPRSDNPVFGCYDDLAGRFGGKELLAYLMTIEVPVLNRNLRLTFFERAAETGRADILRFVYYFKRAEVPWDFTGDSWESGESTVLYRAQNTPSLEVLEFIVDLRSLHPNPTFEGECGAEYELDLCVLAGRLDTVAYALEVGAPPKGVGVMGRPGSNLPVRQACMRGHRDVVEYLLAHGAGQESTIATAAEWGRTALVKRLLDLEISPVGALSKAAAGGYLDVVRLLLDAGVDANETPSVKSPLASAIWKEHTAMFDLLLDLGADLHAEGVAEECVQRAKEDGLESMVLLLKDHGVDIGDR
jgi:hypothetical protein